MTVTNAPFDTLCEPGEDPCNWVYLGTSGRALSFWKLY